MSQHANAPATTQRTYTNVALTAIACLLGLIVINTLNAPNTGLAQRADAQVGIVGETPVGDNSQDGRTNAAEQRKQIISELRDLSARVDQLGKQLEKGINVKVTSMPAPPKN